MTEHDWGKDIYSRVSHLHDVVDENSLIGINGLPLRLCFLIRKKGWLRENWCSVGTFGSLKWSEVRCRPANVLLELLSWPTKSLYQTIVVGRTSNDLFNGPDKCTYQFHYLHHWLRGWWIRKNRDIIIHLYEQPVELILQLWKPTKQLKSNPKVRCIEAYRLEINSERTWPRRRVSLSVPKRCL